MYCRQCLIVLPYKHKGDLVHCTLCGARMIPDIQDVLEYGYGSLTTEQRKEQIRLGKHIEKALCKRDEHTHWAEGGTGIGKSYAYLIPVLTQEKERTVISTANKELQRQLIEKDIPKLKQVLRVEPITTLYKGRNNYFCWCAAKEVPQPDRKKYLEFVDAARNKKIPADIMSWEGPKPYWSDNASVANCINPRKCSFNKLCRPQPQKAQIVVVNHTILAIDLLLGPGKILGPYDTLIIDEAHQATDMFRSAFKHELTPNQLGYLYRGLVNDFDAQQLINIPYQQQPPEVAISADILAKLRTLQKQVADIHALTRKGSKGELCYVDCTVYQDHFEKLQKNAHDTASQLYILCNRINAQHAQGEYVNLTDLNKEKIPSIISKIDRIRKALRKVEDFAAGVALLPPLARESKETDVEYVRNYDPQTSVVMSNSKGLLRQPVDVNKLLGPKISQIPKVILLSATLADAKGDFSFMKNKLGIARKYTTQITADTYPSPFNYHNNSLLYVPRTVPKYFSLKQNPEGHDRWLAVVTLEIVQLIQLFKGDALVLFTSIQDMHSVSNHIQDGELLNHSGITLWVQNQHGDASYVSQQFLATPHSALFGSRSFFDGIDIVGDKLRMVIIPRLPFPNISDPVIKTLADRSNDPHTEVYMPLLLFDIRQMAGRLIRSATDYGIVAILDRRIWTGKAPNPDHYLEIMNNTEPKNRRLRDYGVEIYDALPMKRMQDSFTKLQTFVNKWLTTVKER